MNVAELRPGTRLVDNPVSVIKIIDIKTPRGYPERQLVLFRVEEAPEERIAWFTTALPEPSLRPEPGTVFYLTGVVKRQSRHDGEPQTEVVGVTLEPIR